MTSDLPASSAQQPFASPQPAPVTPTVHAASPPTKQSLKSWWKGFRPPAKGPDTQGNDPYCRLDYFTGDFESKLPKNIAPCFHESSMVDLVAVADGLAPGEVNQVSSDQKTETASFSFLASMPITFPGSTEKLLPPSGFSTHSFGSVINLLLGHKKSSSDMVAKQQSSRLMSSRSKTHHPIPFTPTPFSESSVALLRDENNTGLKCGPLTQSFNNFKIKSSSTFKSAIKHAKRILRIAEEPTGIFGVPLRRSITYASVAISLIDAEGKSYIYGYVPIVVAKCGVYLKEKATNVEGIFRLSGSEKRIKELKTIFDSPDRYGKGLDWAGYTVHDAANVLRRYLNLLPEPIVPLDLYNRFREPLRGHTMQAVGDGEGTQLPNNFDVNKAIATYQQLITELPPLNRQLLLYILDLLAVFASKSDENRMNSQNLAAIFQPGMLSHPSHDMAPVEYRLSQDVLIFLIENQDHFLIGMRGTAADEQTVLEVQNGGTPPPGTPSTPGRSKTTVVRSSSNASAGADSVRKYGGVRRNVSVSSRNSRQSNGALSPASPAYGTSLTNTGSGGVHRSNTVPSKKSPGLPSNRLQKNSGTPSPTTAGLSHSASPRGLSPAAPARLASRSVSPSPPVLTPTGLGLSVVAPPSEAASTVTSQDRLLVSPGEKPLEATTPTRERNVSSLFQRALTLETDKKQPNKLRKKRIPGSSNPSAHSSANSLHTPQSALASPGVDPDPTAQDLADHLHLETIPSGHPVLSNTEPTPPLPETPRATQFGQQTYVRPEDPLHQSDKNLKPIASPTSSLHSRSSFNDQSDMDHGDDAVAVAEQKEKRSRWRLSRRKDESQSLGNTLSPKKALGSDNGAGASSSSVGSSARPRKSFTGDTAPVSPDSLANPHQQSSNESGSARDAGGAAEEKKGPIGWIKSKMREKREENREKEAEKDRNKYAAASSERVGVASKEENRDSSMEEAANAPVQQQSQQ